MIFTSYFAKMKSFPENVIPVSIAAIVPDWYEGVTYGKLAPTYGTLMKYKCDHNEQLYIKRYNDTILKRLNPLWVLHDIQQIITNCDTYPSIPFWDNPDLHVTLICYEKPSSFCHRHLVAEWFHKVGVECKEWEEEE